MRQSLTALFLAFCTSNVAFGQLKVTEAEVPSNSFAEAIVTLPKDGVATFVVTPTPHKMVELPDRVYFNGDPGNYSITVIVSTLEAGKIVTKKHTDTVKLGKAPQPPPVPDAFQTAYDAESDPKKGEYVSKLAALYKTAAETGVMGETNSDIFNNMMAASRRMLPESAIPKVRAVIGSRLNPVLNPPGAKADKTKVYAEFAAIGKALLNIKQ